MFNVVVFQAGKSVHLDTSQRIGSPRLHRVYVVRAVGTTVQDSRQHGQSCRLPLRPLAGAPVPLTGTQRKRFCAAPYEFNNKIDLSKIIRVRRIPGPYINFLAVLNRMGCFPAFVYLDHEKNTPATLLSMTVVFGNTGGLNALDADIFYRERKFLCWRREALHRILWHTIHRGYTDNENASEGVGERGNHLRKSTPHIVVKRAFVFDPDSFIELCAERPDVRNIPGCSTEEHNFSCPERGRLAEAPQSQRAPSEVSRKVIVLR